MITAAELQTICPYAKRERLNLFVEPLNAAMTEFEINTADRESAFIAQIAYESGGFRYVQEIASGEAYEGRADLGNIEPGDGVRFKGRGLIQITGRANNGKCGDALGLDLLAHPELLEDPVNACRSAGWFWSSHGLNELADKEQFQTITRRINGGLSGLPDRITYWKRAREVLL